MVVNEKRQAILAQARKMQETLENKMNGKNALRFEKEIHRNYVGLEFVEPASKGQVRNIQQSVGKCRPKTKKETSHAAKCDVFIRTKSGKEVYVGRK
jgi:hypothetical protein